MFIVSNVLKRNKVKGRQEWMDLRYEGIFSGMGHTQISNGKRWVFKFFFLELCTLRHGSEHELEKATRVERTYFSSLEIRKAAPRHNKWLRTTLLRSRGLTLSRTFGLCDVPTIEENDRMDGWQAAECGTTGFFVVTHRSRHQYHSMMVSGEVWSIYFPISDP